MNIFDLFVGFLPYRYSNVVRYGITGQDAELKNDAMTVLYTCVKILADNFSRLPISLQDRNGREQDHWFTHAWNSQPSTWQNGQTLKSSLEWDRNTAGNGFVEIKGQSLQFVSAAHVRDWELNGGKLLYKLHFLTDPRIKPPRQARTVPSSRMLHFRGLSHDGIFAMSPLVAAHGTHQLMANAIRTVNNFYKNNAMSTMAIERTIPTGGNYQNVVADKKIFKQEQSGVMNAGGTIHLSLGEKVTPLAVKFADAELIKTMEFSRDTLSSLYQIPNWMLSSNDSTQNVEQQTTAFVATTMAGITNSYEGEINSKILTPQDRKKGLHFVMDLNVLKEVTLGDKINALKEAVTNGLMTPNNAAKEMNQPPIKGKYGDTNLVQAQYIPIQEMDQYSPLLKDKPVINEED